MHVESSGDENTKNDGKKTSNRGRSQSKVRSKEPVMSVEQEAMKSPTSKSGKVEQQPQAMEVDHEKAELAKDMPSQGQFSGDAEIHGDGTVKRSFVHSRGPQLERSTNH